MAHKMELDPRVRILAGAAAFLRKFCGERGVVNAVHEVCRRLDPLAFAQSQQEIARLAPGFEARHVDVVAVAGDSPVATGPVERGRGSLAATSLVTVAPVPRRGGLNIVGSFESSTVEGAAGSHLGRDAEQPGRRGVHHLVPIDGRPGLHVWNHRDGEDYPFDTTLLVISPDDVANFVMDNGVAPFEGR